MNRAQRRASGYTDAVRDGIDGLEIKMLAQEDKVVVEFGVKIKWFAMDKSTAETFIKNLQNELKKLEQPKPEEIDHE